MCWSVHMQNASATVGRFPGLFGTAFATLVAVCPGEAGCFSTKKNFDCMKARGRTILWPGPPSTLKLLPTKGDSNLFIGEKMVL